MVGVSVGTRTKYFSNVCSVTTTLDIFNNIHEEQDTVANGLMNQSNREAYQIRRKPCVRRMSICLTGGEDIARD
jgi:hypothetical protein